MLILGTEFNKMVCSLPLPKPPCPWRQPLSPGSPSRALSSRPPAVFSQCLWLPQRASEASREEKAGKAPSTATLVTPFRPASYIGVTRKIFLFWPKSPSAKSKFELSPSFYKWGSGPFSISFVTGRFGGDVRYNSSGFRRGFTVPEVGRPGRWAEKSLTSDF